MKKKKFMYLYRITNTKNGKVYVGIHTTDDMDDGYMGSGTELLKAYRKEGKEHFVKEVLEHYGSIDDLREAERMMVDKTFIESSMTYNKCLGGGAITFYGHITVVDKDGNTRSVSVDDPLYLSGELVPTLVGKRILKDDKGIVYYIDENDPRIESGDLVHICTGTMRAKNKIGQIFTIDVDDPRYLSGELIGVTKGNCPVRDSNGEIHYVSVNDPRLKTGELVGLFAGRSHSCETRQRLSASHIGKYDGKKNSQYGTKWIHNKELKKSKKISKNSPIPEGWNEGRSFFGKSESFTGSRGRIWIHNKKIGESKMIQKNDQIPEGWERGRK